MLAGGRYESASSDSFVRSRWEWLDSRLNNPCIPTDNKHRNRALALGCICFPFGYLGYPPSGARIPSAVLALPLASSQPVTVFWCVFPHLTISVSLCRRSLCVLRAYFNSMTWQPSRLQSGLDKGSCSPNYSLLVRY
ncbi:hypothetical protein AG1IA_06723 [Rhizoctonia solani AG-1 IA]|uniref:Uncharacterized protein n=1 Tax=Thanatephorus cucumeris (strain AG1-IA) TaxID=983506 RepID=L8WM72_THACA|nr:hypothetical protein AG1IA_06723 [Rhizoctonia solani AG-1 IA]